MEKISSCLVAWYMENKRDLPWRENRDAYRVWVSEIMLQQTRVEAVKPYFTRFIKALPTLASLATVEDDYLVKLWEGLGYYSRVRNMKKAAITCMEKYDGKLPSSYEELLNLSGIGPYTAGAIASIAYKQSVCAIDGNVLRVYARLFAIKEDILLTKTRNKIQSLIELDKAEDMGIFNQALMDLGAGICVPNSNPRCNICPLSNFCLAYKQGLVNQLPVRIKKTKRTSEKYTVLIYVCNGQVLLHKREDTGLLAGLYEFVLKAGHKKKSDFKNGVYLGKYKHVFSHKEWHMKGFLIECDECFSKEGHFWTSIANVENVYSIPSAYKYYKDQFFALFNE
ncbi:MAG: A/G-specific adenine glycosylase [Erysipelotrichia bacterium]|nr:A/G-specific adenine glycosylase [Erysipelotrichia bacterium]NCC55500.1 A/G-specific adenine glycosylase [Erysipelotrichia bacterium]